MSNACVSMDFVRSREEDFFCRQSAKSTFTLRGTFFYIMRTTTFCFSFFPLFFVEEEEEKAKQKRKGKLCGEEEFLFLDAILALI